MDSKYSPLNISVCVIILIVLAISRFLLSRVVKGLQSKLEQLGYEKEKKVPLAGFNSASTKQIKNIIQKFLSAKGNESNRSGGLLIIKVLHIAIVAVGMIYCVYYFADLFNRGYSPNKSIWFAMISLSILIFLIIKLFIKKRIRFRYVFSIGIFAFVIVYLCVSLLRMHYIGWSFFEKDTKITVLSKYYSKGIKDYEQLDYDNAKQNFLRALKETEKTKSNANLEVAEINQKLGALYLDMGNYKESYECLNSAYTTFDKELGRNDGRTVVAKCQIYLYDIKVGEVERGFAGLNETFTEIKSVKYKMQIFQMIAQAYTAMGNYKRAMEFYNLLAEYYNNFVGLENPSFVNMINDMSVLFCDIGEYEKSLSGFKAAESYWKKYAKQNDAVIANVYSNMAALYARMGEEAAALETSQKAAEIYKKLYGENSFYTAIAYKGIGDMYGAMQMPDKELVYLNKSLKTMLSAVGENHAATAIIYNSIGGYYADAGDITKAIENSEKALQIRKNILGKNNLDTAAVYESICNIYDSAGQYKEAIENGLEAIKINEKLFGKDNPNTARSYLLIAWPYANSNQIDKALEYAYLGVDINKRHLNENSENVAFAYQTLGYVLKENKQYKESEMSLYTAAEKYISLYGNNHKSVGNSYKYLGMLYREMGSYERALDYFQKANNIMSSYETDINSSEDIE